MIKRKKKNIFPFWLSVPALCIYTLFVITPVILSVGLSFTDWNIRRWNEPVLVGIKNFMEILKNEVFIRSIGNTFMFAIGSTILKIVFGLGLALILYKPFKGNSIFRTIFYLPCVLSCVVIGVLFTAVLSPDGLLNNILGVLHLDTFQMPWLGSYGTAMFWIVLIEGWMWAGFNMFIFISGLQAIPRDYYEAACTEGASAWVQFKQITLPLLIPAVTVNVTLNISGGMKVFDLVYVLTNGGPGTDTQVLSTYVFRTFGLGFLGESAAASLILTILVVIISYAFNNFFRKREVEL